jgi:hypothetical protein
VILRRPSLLLLALLAVSRPALRAEHQLSYKFQSWQEDNGRVRVDAHYALAETDVSLATRIRLMGVIDTIAGATPTGAPPAEGSDQVPLAHLDDVRRAWQAELTHQFTRHSLSGSVSSSRESDYTSRAFALNALTFFNQKATTLLTGIGRADDKVSPRFFSAPRPKRTDEVIVGLTQLLNPRTSVTVNLTYSQARGYLSDPYKLVGRTVELLPGLTLPLTFPENRPSSKDRWIVLASVNRRIESVGAAIEASYRWTDDSFGTTSHTGTIEWYQRLGPRLILRPGLRVYQQSAADFYHPRLDLTGVQPSEAATGLAPHYSSDYRLAALRTYTIGWKLVWEPLPRLAVDATYERYLMRLRDSLTPRSAPVDADVFTVGVRIWR